MMYTFRNLLLGSLALTASLATSVRAQITVDSPPGTFSSLALAVQSANAGATITIDDTNPLTLFECNIVIDGSQDPLTIVPLNNIYPPNVTIDGTGCSGSIFVFQPGAGQVTNATLLHGLRIINGTGTMVNGRLVGGGIACLDGASPLIRNCIVNNNTAYDGGGIYIGQTENSLGPRVMRNVIRLNQADNSGGGVYLELVQGDFAGASQFSRSRINENTAVWAGGGMYAGGGTSPAMDLCWFFDNHVTFYGAGICLEGTLDASISSTMVESNDTGISGGGGGLAVLSASSTRVENSTFSLNTAASGGGIYDQSINGFPAGPSEYFNDLIVDNHVGGFGGGMVAGTFDPKVEFCTIAFNTAGTSNGGGIYSTGVNVDHSIVWGNSTPQFLTAGGTATVSHSDVQGGIGGTNNINSNPVFANGAGTAACANTSLDTYHLDQALSPCVDYGPLVVNPNHPAVIGRSTNPDRLIADADASLVDLGFHYPGQGCH